MIYPKKIKTASDVAQHYNELDPFYRSLWGEHLHHGYWETGKETQEEAVKALVELVAQKAHLQPGMKVCDVGCGYGATARQLVDKWKVKVQGMTVSETQYQFLTPTSQMTFHLCDWLNNSLPAKQFDSVISIESSEHMEDKLRFFQESFRVLRPGGRMVVCAWLSKENPSKMERKLLLEPICDEGRLPSLGSMMEYKAFFEEAGFKNIQYQDISKHVSKTWTICCKNAFKGFFSDFRLRRYLFNHQYTERGFLKSLLRLRLAYALECMHYGVFSAEK